MIVHLDDISKLEINEKDFTLLNGDLLMIPESPRAVTVLGEVYNPVSIVAIPGKTVDYYLQKVGGPKKSADIGSL